jgi:hypothetical protein
MASSKNCKFYIKENKSTFEATYRVWNIWVYPDVIMANANGD